MHVCVCVGMCVCASDMKAEGDCKVHLLECASAQCVRTALLNAILQPDCTNYMFQIV